MRTRQPEPQKPKERVDHLSDFTCSETTGSNDTSPPEPKPKRARPDTSGDEARTREQERAAAAELVTSFATLVDNAGATSMKTTTTTMLPRPPPPIRGGAARCCPGPGCWAMIEERPRLRNP